MDLVGDVMMCVGMGGYRWGVLEVLPVGANEGFVGRISLGEVFAWAGLRMGGNYVLVTAFPTSKVKYNYHTF